MLFAATGSKAREQCLIKSNKYLIMCLLMVNMLFHFPHLECGQGGYSGKKKCIIQVFQLWRPKFIAVAVLRRFPGHRPLSRGEPIPGRPALHKKKRTLPGAPAGFSGVICVTALDTSRRLSPPLQIQGSEPDSLSIDRGRGRPSPRASERRSPIS